MDSLRAETSRNPGLLLLKSEDGDENPPKILFSRRRKGYFKARNLERVNVLNCLRWARSRGELFVHWKNGNSSHYGRQVLAHIITIKYCANHDPGKSPIYVQPYIANHICAIIYVQYSSRLTHCYNLSFLPAMSVSFHKDGSLKSTSEWFRLIRAYVPHTDPNRAPLTHTSTSRTGIFGRRDYHWLEAFTTCQNRRSTTKSRLPNPGNHYMTIFTTAGSRTSPPSCLSIRKTKSSTLL